MKLIQYIYDSKTYLVYFTLFSTVLFLAMGIVWCFTPENTIFGPIITTFGFFLAILQITPIAISKAFPEVMYKLEFNVLVGEKSSSGHVGINKFNKENSPHNNQYLVLEILNLSEQRIILNELMIQRGTCDDYSSSMSKKAYIDLLTPGSIKNEKIEVLPFENYFIYIDTTIEGFRNLLNLILDSSNAYITLNFNHKYTLNNTQLNNLNLVNRAFKNHYES